MILIVMILLVVERVTAAYEVAGGPVAWSRRRAGGTACVGSAWLEFVQQRAGDESRRTRYQPHLLTLLWHYTPIMRGGLPRTSADDLRTRIAQRPSLLAEESAPAPA